MASYNKNQLPRKFWEAEQQSQMCILNNYHKKEINNRGGGGYTYFLSRFAYTHPYRDSQNNTATHLARERKESVVTYCKGDIPHHLY